MRKFKTIFVLEIVTGIILREHGTFKGIVDVVAYVCNMGKPSDISAEQFFTFIQLNNEKLIKEIIDQHPVLSSIKEEALKLKEELYEEDWINWADDKIVVQKNRIQEIITAHHDPIVACHWGVHRTLSMIQRRFYFPRMRKLVADHISSCDVCQHAKADHHRPRGLM